MLLGSSGRARRSSSREPTSNSRCSALIGVGDKDAGELPKVFVVRKNNRVTAEEIHQFVQG